MAVDQLSAGSRLSYSRTQRRFFDLLMVAQYWKPEQMQSYQQRQLTSLLKHARANVPFYRERVGTLFRDDEVDWERWLDLPIVTRDDLLNRRSEMQATRISPAHGAIAEFSTSGSTGAPITTTHNAITQVMAAATLLRMQVWHGLDWT